LTQQKEKAKHGKLNEFSGTRVEMKAPPTSFPEVGLPEVEVLEALWSKLRKNVDPQRNWAQFGPQAHPFAKKVFSIPEAIDTYAVEWGADIFPGINEMSQESVRMIGSLLGAVNPAGFITTGGTEANLLGIRLARNLAKKSRPEFIVPYSRHYSFDLAEELLGVKMRTIDVDENYSPKMEQVKSLINENTVALVCSAPEAHLGGIDPVEEFSEIAERHHLYLHVDAAVGGFLLPFMRKLGYNVPPFDFSLRSVSSMTTDPHKLGLSVRPSGGFIVRDSSFFERAIDIKRLQIDTIVASGRPGSAAAAVWALIKHLGTDGYCRLVENTMQITKILADGVRRINGLRLLREPQTNMVCFTADSAINIEKIAEHLWEKRYAIALNRLSPFETMFIRLYVHPLKEKTSATSLIADLEQAAMSVKRGG
jgi:tyrosine decarboxylase/aspartate 1-decarboxylase